MISSESRMNDLLGPVAYPELGAAIRNRADRICERWIEQTKELITKTQRNSPLELRNSVPILLDQIANTLEFLGPVGGPVLRQMAQSHGTIRHRQGYDLEELAAEYRILRRIITEEVHDELTGENALEKGLALNMCIDCLFQEGFIFFAEEVRRQSIAETTAEAKYLSFLSHDLRNRLNQVFLAMQLIKQKLELPHEKALIDSFTKSLRDILEGMDRILQAERTTKRGTPPVRQEVHLRELIWTIAAPLTPEAKKKGMDINVDVPAAAVVHSDSELISLCLTNLIGNAIKFSSEGIVHVGAKKSSRDNVDGWLLSVADEGPGIAEGKLKILFDVFSRGETHGMTGMGLGLAISSHAAKILGTRIEVDSTLGVGSVFSLFLPA